jgi:hypothetical protein
MYLLLDGDVRVSQVVDGRETIWATLEIGDLFWGGAFLTTACVPRAWAMARRKRDGSLEQHKQVGIRSNLTSGFQLLLHDGRVLSPQPDTMIHRDTPRLHHVLSKSSGKSSTKV